MVGCSSCVVFVWNNNSLPKTTKMRKTITFKNKSTSTIDTPCYTRVEMVITVKDRNRDVF